MKKVLFLTYRFPPQGGGGVQRTLKFTKYVRDFGWEPVVHTARNPYWPVWDETLLEEIPAGVRVYRTPAFEFERLEHRLTRLLGGRRAGAHGGGGTGTAGNGARKPVARRGGWLHAIRAAVHGSVLVPDPQIAWLPGALLRTLVIARRERIDVLVTSSPPNSVHLLGWLVAAALGRPWIADFRDPWTDGIRRQRAYVGNPRRAALERAAERAVLRRADRAIVSAEPLRGRFLAKYPFLSPDRVVVLTNGYDPADFAAAETAGGSALETGCFHVTNTGNIEAMFDAGPFFRAIAELVGEDPGLRADLRVNLFGAKLGKCDADLAALGLTERVRYCGWVPHAQSLRRLQESDVLLMCQLRHPAGGGEKLSGKCFEYLRVDKPILCLTVPGLTADLLAESGLGTVVDPADVAGIKTAIRQLYAQRREPVRGNAALIARFDRRHLTQRLVAIFDELCDTPSADRGTKGRATARVASTP